MAPRNKVEFVILRLTYLPYVHPLYPRITLNSRKHSPSGSLVQMRDWFDSIMAQERAHLPRDANVRYSEWRIMSGDLTLFTVNDFRFDKVMLVLGEDNIYWQFYNSGSMLRRIEGCAPLALTYCGCCLNNQYLQVIEKVKATLTQCSDEA